MLTPPAIRTSTLAAQLLLLAAVGAQSPMLVSGHEVYLELTSGGSLLRFINVGTNGLGDPLVPASSPALARQAVPHVYAGFPNLTATDGGTGHAVGLTPGGGVVGWGSNGAGQLGAAPGLGQTLPPISVPVPPATQVAAGHLFSLAVSSGTVRQWGAISSSTVGPTPTVVPFASPVLDVSAKWDWALARDISGVVHAWGRDVHSGGGGHLPTPVPLPGVLNVQLVSAGYDHGVALTNTGILLSWGSSYAGQLGGVPSPVAGNPSLSTQVPPVPLQQISAGGAHTVALAVNGTVWSFGANVYGQLGHGDKVYRPDLTQVPGLSQIIAVAANEWGTAALRQDGTLFAWGRLGQTGGVQPGVPGALPPVSLIPMQVRSSAPFPAVFEPRVTRCAGGFDLTTDQVPFLGNASFRLAVPSQILTGPPAPPSWLFASMGLAALQSNAFGAPGNCLYLDLASASSLVASGFFPLTPAGLEARTFANGGAPSSFRPYYAFPIPNLAILYGATMTFQAASPAPNTAGFVTSPPVQITMN